MKAKGHRITGTICALALWIITYITTLQFQWNWNEVLFFLKIINHPWWFEIFPILLAIYTGYSLPDEDLHIDFITHRWFFTHSSIIPVFCFLIFPCITSGFLAVLNGTHLLCDIKRKLAGYGRIHIFGKLLTSNQSIFWLLINGLICWFLGFIQIWM